MIRFECEPMVQVATRLRDRLAQLEASEILSFEAPDPDLGGSCYCGTEIKTDSTRWLHHSWKAWIDLCDLLFCRMLTPQITTRSTVIVRFQKLDRADSFHQSNISQGDEKYGVDSGFALIHKNEEPAFLFAYLNALKQVKIEQRRMILDLGVNRADEFILIRSILEQSVFEQMQFVGIDHSISAIDYAKKLFSSNNVTFYCHDINQLGSLALPRSDLIISIGTLQSQGIDLQPLLRSLVQRHLTQDGALILGFPNCRWIDGAMVYGAKAPNYNFSEMSLLIKDIYFCKKYLQQHKFRVTITGKEYLFLTATKIGVGL